MNQPPMLSVGEEVRWSVGPGSVPAQTLSLEQVRVSDSPLQGSTGVWFHGVGVVWCGKMGYGRLYFVCRLT